MSYLVTVVFSLLMTLKKIDSIGAGPLNYKRQVNAVMQQSVHNSYIQDVCCQLVPSLNVIFLPSAIAQCLYGVFPVLLSHSSRSDHVTQNAQAARKNQAQGLDMKVVSPKTKIMLQLCMKFYHAQQHVNILLHISCAYYLSSWPSGRDISPHCFIPLFSVYYNVSSPTACVGKADQHFCKPVCQ